MTMKTQIEILRVLKDATGHPLLESVLRSQVDVRLRPRPTKADYDDAITNLRSKGFIAIKGNELDDEDPYWMLDEKGEAFAIQQKL